MEQLLVGEDRLELLDLAQQLVALGLELDPGEPGQAAQLQLEDVVGLGSDRSKTEISRASRGGGVVGGADQLDDLVDVEDRDEQALDEVQPVLALAQPELGAAAARPRSGSRRRCAAAP